MAEASSKGHLPTNSWKNEMPINAREIRMLNPNQNAYKHFISNFLLLILSLHMFMFQKKKKNKAIVLGRCLVPRE